MTVALICIAVVAVGGAMLYLRASSRRAKAMSAALEPVVFRGTVVPLDQAIWAVASVGDASAVGARLAGLRAFSPQAVADELDTFVAAYSPADVQAVEAKVKQILHAEREIRAWEVQSEALETAFAAGLLDVAILTIGANEDWVNVITEQIESLPVDALLAHGLLSQTGLTTVLPDHLDGLAVGALQTVLEPVGDGLADLAAGGIGSVLDSGVPFVTVGRALYKANQASAAGLDNGRVVENAATDIGLAGGGIAIGAAIGSVVPVVGTMIGGAVGGFVGRAASTYMKGRHLESAQQAAIASLDAFGRTVSARSFGSITEEAKAVITNDKIALSRLGNFAGDVTDHWYRAAPAGWFAVMAATEHGHLAATDRADRYEEWCEEVSAVAKDSDGAYRGAVIATRPDLQARLGIKRERLQPVHAAQKLVGVERDKLKLA